MRRELCGASGGFCVGGNKAGDGREKAPVKRGREEEVEAS